MTDRENIIKTLNDALTAKENYPWAKAEMSFDFIRMLIELLKEQEPVKPKTEDVWPRMIDTCGVCGACLFAVGDHKQKYCSECGKPVKWDDV